MKKCLSIFMILILICVWIAGAMAEAGWLYTDPISGLKMTVPAGWTEKEPSQDRQTIDVKFVHSSGISIMFGCEDLWAMLEKEYGQDFLAEGYARDSMDSYMLTEADFREIAGSNAKVERKTYAGQEFFCTTAEQEVFGLRLRIMMLMCIRNGYIYTIYFNGTENSTYYEAFESFMNSLQFP